MDFIGLYYYYHHHLYPYHHHRCCCRLLIVVIVVIIIICVVIIIVVIVVVDSSSLSSRLISIVFITSFVCSDDFDLTASSGMPTTAKDSQASLGFSNSFSISYFAYFFHPQPILRPARLR